MMRIQTTDIISCPRCRGGVCVNIFDKSECEMCGGEKTVAASVSVEELADEIRKTPIRRTDGGG